MPETYTTYQKVCFLHVANKDTIKVCKMLLCDFMRMGSVSNDPICASMVEKLGHLISHCSVLQNKLENLIVQCLQPANETYIEPQFYEICTEKVKVRKIWEEVKSYVKKTMLSTEVEELSGSCETSSNEPIPMILKINSDYLRVWGKFPNLTEVKRLMSKHNE